MYLNKKKNYSLININQFPVSDSKAVKEGLIRVNGITNEYGLVLTVKEVNRLSEAVSGALRESGRIEIGEGIMPVLAEEFSSSVFVNIDNYAEVLEELVYVFFNVKTALCDKIADRELVRILKDFYENKAYGSVEIMRDKDIDILVKYIETEMGSQSSAGDVYDSDSYTDERA